MDEVATFFRRFPVLDVVWLVGWALALWKWGWPNPAKADETDRERRAASAKAITNQINAILTAASILLAAVGALLAIAFDKPQLPRAAREHLVIAAGAALVAMPFGVYTLGYIPSVIHRLDVARKPAVMIACFIQINLIIVSAARFALALWHLARHLPSS